MTKIKFIILLVAFIKISLVSAKNYSLTFEPDGLIIEILYSDLKLYTDTATIFKYFENDKKYLNKIKDCVEGLNQDTITFGGEFHKTSNKKCIYNYWYNTNLFIHLIKINKIKIVSADGEVIEKIYTNKEGCRWKRESITRNYIDKKTKVKLFYEWERLIIRDPRIL